MKEIEDIVASYKKAKTAGKKTALATVVHVEGSSYRRPGARMLVTEDGELTGAISGGCLEGDALRKALLAINQQQNKLVTYDSMDEDDNSFGIQLGCNGIVHILFEPIDAAVQNNPIQLLEMAATQNNNSVLATVFSLANPQGEQIGTCLFANEQELISNATSSASILQNEVQGVLQSGASIMKQHENGTAFIELVPPAVELVIAGAGNDAFPLLQMADVLGWHVTVMDGRKTHATERRFPAAKKIIVAKPAEGISQINITHQTVFVLMSHNYNYDLAMLQELIHSSCQYIGVLGPKKKMEKMYTELQDKGVAVTEQDKEKIFGPVGLDVGAETAEEIALSIVAEIKAVLSKRAGASLRNKDGFIHDHATAVSNQSSQPIIKTA